MSRIGKKTIHVPEKVELKITGHSVSVKGPKGQLHLEASPLVKLEFKGHVLTVGIFNSDRRSKCLWGTTRTLIDNMVVGVTTGFTKALEFNGVGYKAAVKGKILELSLGYSHSINFQLPEGISAVVNKNTIEISGSNKELVGQVAAKVRAFRPPEPYKGKGIKYANEKIIRKAGKTGGK